MGVDLACHENLVAFARFIAIPEDDIGERIDRWRKNGWVPAPANGNGAEFDDTDAESAAYDYPPEPALASSNPASQGSVSELGGDSSNAESPVREKETPERELGGTEPGKANGAGAFKDYAPRFYALFLGNEAERVHYSDPGHGANGAKFTPRYVTVDGGATPKHWLDHLTEAKPLGVIPNRADNKCRWGSIDLDQYDVDPLIVIEKVESAALPLVPARSKSGGMHLLLFTWGYHDCGTCSWCLGILPSSLASRTSKSSPSRKS
jgi:hypothetical protein